MTFLMMLSDIAVYANDTALYYKPFFSIWVFFHEYSRITGLQGKGEGISLTPHYHFHPLHRHLDISRAITAESSPLHIDSNRTRAKNLWFLSLCDQASDLWQQLELVSELASDLQDTVDWGRKWLVDFGAGKTQLISFDRFNNTGAIDVKINRSVLEEKSCVKMLKLTFSSKLD